MEFHLVDEAQGRLTIAHDGMAEWLRLVRKSDGAVDRSLPQLEESLIQGFAGQLGAKIETSDPPGSSITVCFPMISAGDGDRKTA
jgi:hypothetical protein